MTYVGWYRASRFELGRSPRGATYKITFAVDDQEGQRVREVDIVLVDDLLTLRRRFIHHCQLRRARLATPLFLSQTPPRDWIERKTERAKDRRGQGGSSALTPRSMSPTPRNVPTCLHSGSLAYSFWTTGSRQVCCKGESGNKKQSVTRQTNKLSSSHDTLRREPDQVERLVSLTSGLTAALRVKVGLNLPIQLPALTMIPLARTPLAWRSNGEDEMTPARRFTFE